LTEKLACQSVWNRPTPPGEGELDIAADKIISRDALLDTLRNRPFETLHTR